jgi:hypothetical protein
MGMVVFELFKRSEDIKKFKIIKIVDVPQMLKI